MKALILAVLLVSLYPPVLGQAKPGNANGPDCGGPDHWAAGMTFTHMKNAGLLDNNTIARTDAVRIASQRIGKDLWHQVYRVIFTKKSGEVVEAIAVHDASTEECSMSGVEVFVVSKHLGELEKIGRK